MRFMAVLTLHVAIRAPIAGPDVLVKPVHAAGGRDVMLEISSCGIGIAGESWLDVLPGPTIGVAVEAKSFLTPGFAEHDPNRGVRSVAGSTAIGSSGVIHMRVRSDRCARWLRCR